MKTREECVEEAEALIRASGRTGIYTTEERTRKVLAAQVYATLALVAPPEQVKINEKLITYDIHGKAGSGAYWHNVSITPSQGDHKHGI